MEKLYKFKSSFRISIFIALIIALTAVLLSSGALAQDGQQDRQKLVQQLVDRWIQIGTEQYERGYYKAAEQSFLMAKDYEEYLGSQQRSELEDLLAKAHAATAGMNSVSGDIARAQQFLAEGKTEEARSIFQRLRDSQYLTPEDRQIVEKGLAATKDEAAGHKAEIASLYNKSVELYNSGQLEQARKGFIEVAKSGLMVAPVGSRAEDYLTKIDTALADIMIEENQTQMQPQTDAAQVEQELFGPSEVKEDQMQIIEPLSQITAQPAVSQAAEQGDGYIEVIQRRQNILRSYTQSVVNDALAKARSYQDSSEFDQAVREIEYAQNIVNTNRMQLGEEMFKNYSEELQSMRDQIASARTAYQAAQAEQARIAAEQAQKDVREQMTQDREGRINQLMENTLAYQKQQRYREALGQLESLLAIDPLNNQALIMKDTLTDTISFEEQLRIIKEKQQEKANLLIETSRSEIPYTSEMTIPKNWLEISARRQPKEAIGQDPATSRVYEQLETVVNLSELRPDMSFSEALDILRNSVDPPLKIVPLWRDLYDNADIDQTTPINMDPISAVKLSSALRFLLEAVSGGFAQLDYGVENGIVTIATEESIPADLITQVYDVTDLVGQPAEYRTETTGGGGGGGGGVSDVGGGFTDQGGQEDLSAEELRTRQQERIDDMILLIQDTVAPESWFDAGGEGTITSYGTRLLSIRQTADVHNQVSSLLDELRKSHGYQVAIEARFLTVRENFLEEIGLDIDFLYNGGGKWGEISFQQGSAAFAEATPSGIEGSIPDLIGAAGSLSGQYGGILDDLMVSFILNATQAYGEASLVTAPKATVLSGESATFRLQRVLYYARDIEIDTTAEGDTATPFAAINYDEGSVTSGTVLNISPTISPDKKHVLLNIDVTLSDFLGFRNQAIDLTGIGAPESQVNIQFPEVEASQVRTRVSVPDGGTLLLGGQKLGAEIDKEAGVPVLSKIPILGRAFSNRSKVKDHKILLILVKPTIILQEEVEADAVAEMQKSF
ncbi:MAG: hypothetical protein WC374_02230 [Phycisphaerae bacterium]